MLTILVVLDVFLAIAIIASVFFHKGADGFMGEATPTLSAGGTHKPHFETYDKIIACLVAAFFAVTLSINYIHLYKNEGTAIIDDILAKKQKDNVAQDIEKKDIGAKDDAPLAK